PVGDDIAEVVPPVPRDTSGRGGSGEGEASNLRPISVEEICPADGLSVQTEEELGRILDPVSVGREVKVREEERRILNAERPGGGIVRLVLLDNFVERIDLNKDRMRPRLS